MNIGLQELLVALIMLVPGFITTTILRAFAPKRFASDLRWISASLLIAIVLNIMVLIPFLITHTATLYVPINELTLELQNVSLITGFVYITMLYLSSISLGLILGFFPILSLRNMLNRFGLTSFAEHPSVWDRIFEVRRPKDRPITWLRLHLEDGRVILGHLRHSSEYIDKDRAFEVYLELPHEWVNEEWRLLRQTQEGNKVDGIYARLLPNQVAEFFFTEKGWKP